MLLPSRVPRLSSASRERRQAGGKESLHDSAWRFRDFRLLCHLRGKAGTASLAPSLCVPLAVPVTCGQVASRPCPLLPACLLSLWSFPTRTLSLSQSKSIIKKKSNPIYNCTKNNKIPRNKLNQGGERLVL